ncbi:PIN domain-containing protein [Lysobacter fragariae]
MTDAPPPTPSIPRIVLDTNVCLDLFVFADPRVATLHAALRERRIEAVTDAACRGEWQRVLAYPQWKLDDDAQSDRLARFDALVVLLGDGGGEVGNVLDTTGSTPADASAPPASDVLPRCRDPDDQKFLELALRTGANWLLSRDHHLLSMNRRLQRSGLFPVLTPQQWEHWEAARNAPAPATADPSLHSG